MSYFSRKGKMKAAAFKPDKDDTHHGELRKRNVQRIFLAMIFCTWVAALTHLPESKIIAFDDVDTSIIPKEDIKSTIYFDSVDVQQTNEAQKQSMASVPDYYQVDRDRVEQQMYLLRERVSRIQEERPRIIEALHQALLESTDEKTPEEITASVVLAHVTALKEDPEWERMPEAQDLKLWLTPDPASLPQRQFATPEEIPVADAPPEETPTPRKTTGLQTQEDSPITFSIADKLNQMANDGLEFVLVSGIRATALPPNGGNATIVITRERPPAELEVATRELILAEVPDIASANEVLSGRLREAAMREVKLIESTVEWAQLYEATLAMAGPSLTDTIRYDEGATLAGRQRARESTAPILRQIDLGQIIQADGRRWTEQSREDFKAYLEILGTEQQPAHRIWAIVLAHAIIVMLALFALQHAVVMLRPSRSMESEKTQLNLALLLISTILILGRIAYYFEPSGLMLPIAAVAILYSILVSGRLGIMVGALGAFLISAQYNYDWRLLLVGTVMSMAGAMSIYRVRRRSDFARAAFKSTCAGLIAMAATTLAMDINATLDVAAQHLALVLLNGSIGLMIIPGLLPPLERLFGITTDIQLLEYSDLNNEVLSKLAIEVPATYAHSLMLGQLAEAAADAIGANGLKARVCAYYHDIGKMKRPEYFCENQTGENIHDELSPRLSARAIVSHVIQGAEMAKSAHLPKPIVDGILEHHGTSMIGYFHQLAMEQQKHGDVEEVDFRYPGPRPQSPETAILMICDAVESGTRSIKNPNEERVREFVDKIIQSRSEDRQFDDCHLTLKQLDTIADVVTRRIVSNLHGRIAYPDAKKASDEDNIITLSGGSA